MSQTRAQLLSPVGIFTGTGISINGIITATSFVGDGSGLINVAGGGGGAGSLIVKDSGTLAGTIGTIDFGAGMNVTDAIAGIITVTAADSNTTYTQDAVASGDNVNLRLSGNDSSTDDILVTAGDNITITSVTSNGFTINSTSVEATKVLTIGVRTGAAVSFALPSSTFNVIGRSGNNIPITV